MASHPTDPTAEFRLRAGACDPVAARALADRLDAAGLRAGPADAVEDLFAPGTSVAVVLAKGWEDRIRFALEAVSSDAPCPPGVVLLADDPAALAAAPLAYAALPTSVEPRRLAAVVWRAARSWAAFARRWPYPARTPPPRDLDAIAEVLEQETGLSLHTVRRRPFREAVRRRVLGGLFPSSRRYAHALHSRARTRSLEIEHLAALLAVNETHFWRHAGQFTTLMTQILPSLRGRSVKIWSAGCATGEEPYSIAMACLETLGRGAAFEVVGTDFHSPSLARARQGMYRIRSVRNLPPDLQRRYLEREGEEVRVKEAVRAVVRFERVNLASPELEHWVRSNGPFRVIFCRNTLMYFTPRAAARVVRHLAAGLEEGGALFLGMSESLWPRPRELEAVRAAGCFYYRKRRADRECAPDPEPPAVRGASLDELYRAGLALLDAERFGEAEKVFSEILAADPGDPRGHTGLAVLRANEGREAEADHHLRQALLNPGLVPEAYYLLGLLAERRGDDETALRRYGEALERDPALTMACVNRSWILHRLGRVEGAIREMERGLEALRAGAGVPLWMTGGMDRDALEDMVRQTLIGWREHRGERA